jgi:hypothetical protein
MNIFSDQYLVTINLYIVPLLCILTAYLSDNTIDSILDIVLGDSNLFESITEHIFYFHYIRGKNLGNSKCLTNTKIETIFRYLKTNYKNNNFIFHFKKHLNENINNPIFLRQIYLKYQDDVLNKLKSFNKPLIIFNELPLDISSSIQDYLSDDITCLYSMDKILDILPSDIWNNLDSKWLIDSYDNGLCCTAIYIRLMKTLKKFLPNFETRQKHILENMIYITNFGDLDEDEMKDSFFWCNFYLNPHRKFSLNILSRPICTLNIQFNIIFYNEYKISHHVLIQKITRLLDKIQLNGYLLFIHSYHKYLDLCKLTSKNNWRLSSEIDKNSSNIVNFELKYQNNLYGLNTLCIIDKIFLRYTNYYYYMIKKLYVKTL